MEIIGTYTTAIVHTDNIEQEAINRINDIVNCRAFEGQTVHFMPDVHASLPVRIREPEGALFHKAFR